VPWPHTLFRIICKDRLSYRCFTAKGKEQVPLFGPCGLAAQIGSVEYARPRRFREKLEEWLDFIRILWPECPATIGANGSSLMLNRGYAVNFDQRGERRA
jgi:hypothetical protein